MKVLLVEDNHDLADIYRLKFTNMGHEVRSHQDGRVPESDKDWADVILLDIMLPYISGLEVAYSTTKPVVFLTQLDSDYLERNYTMADNVVGYIRKADHDPSDIVQLVEGMWHGGV